MEPVSSTVKARIAIESLAAAGVSAVALSMTTSEVAIGVSAVSTLIGVVVWLVRLEGRINLQEAILQRIDRRVGRLVGDGE